MPPTGSFQRRWMQFSLRGLLFLTLIVAVVFATLTPNMRRARQQRTVLAIVEKYGGQVQYDFEDSRRGTRVPRQHPSTNARLRKIFGDDFFDKIVAIEIQSRRYWSQSPAPAAAPSLDDDGFRQIAALSDLRILKVDESRLTDEGAKKASWLVTLEELRLSSRLITDRSIEALTRLPELRRLGLSSPGTVRSRQLAR